MSTCRAADGTSLFYVLDETGPGTPIVLVHGLFCSYRLFDRLTRRLEGRTVIRPDIRGHGQSGRPHDAARYRWKTFGDDVAALLDHLGIERAVIGGLSLGANIALSVAEHHLDRCAGLIIEMPVLAAGHRAAVQVFPPVLRAGRLLQPVLDPPTRLIRGLPSLPCQPELGLLKDVLSIDIDAMGALESGLLESDEPFPGCDREALGRVRVPTLVIGHHFDGLHAFADSHDTAASIRGSQLVETRTIADLRVQPARYGRIVNGWLDEHGL